MGSSGMGVDANGKPIKRQAPANQKKSGNNNNQKKGNNNNKNNSSGNRNNQGNRGGGNQNNRQNMRQQPMPLIPPFGPMGGPMGVPMGPGGYMGGPPGSNYFNGQGGNGGGGQNNRRSGGGKNNGNRNGVQQQGYNGPSANNVGQGDIGRNMNPVPSFGAPEPSSMEVPGFGKNSNIHELFGKMIWRKMEQIQDPVLVDQLQNRIMNLIHDAIAGRNEQQSGFNPGVPFGGPTNQKGPAFASNSNGGFSRF